MGAVRQMNLAGLQLNDWNNIFLTKSCVFNNHKWLGKCFVCPKTKKQNYFLIEKRS